jgi:hypothetical protein
MVRNYWKEVETPNDLFYYFLELKKPEKNQVIELVKVFDRHQIIYLREELKMRMNITNNQLRWDCHGPVWYQLMLKEKENLINLIDWLSHYLNDEAIAFAECPEWEETRFKQFAS